MAGLAAIARIIDEASPAMRITAVVAADAETLKRTLVPSDTTNIHATDPHSIDPLLVALRNDASIDIGPNTYVFGAGESLEMAAIRTHLRHDRNVATNRFSVNGYWRRDRGVHASGAVRLGPACMAERRHMSDAAWQRR